MPGDEASLGDEQTFEGGALPSDSVERSLGDQSTFGDGDSSSVSDLDGPATDADFDMEVVDLSARYAIEQVLGQGGMGQVLLATDTRLNRKVAIKRMRDEAVRSRTAVSRFLTEAKSIAALSNHPNIVDIYDFGRDEAGPFLIMEYVDGGSLLDRCRDGALPLDEAVHITCQLCSALEMAHEVGIIHRDIKPANVLLTKDGVPALTDFGLARQDSGDSGMTVTGAVLGTVDFMPPEQRKDAALTDARSDLWSLAATLYQMVTGRSPRVIRLHELPVSLQPVLGKALEDDKDDRYQTAQEFRDALRPSVSANAAAPVASGDLGAGECLNCHATNESSRKFCLDCASPLRVNCLSCNEEFPVWDKVCGECGAKQDELVEERRESMLSLQSQAGSLLKDCDFTAAANIATNLRDELDIRLQQSKEWSEQFLLDVETARENQRKRNRALLAEALQHEQAFDYPAGVHALKQVPELLRDESIPGQTANVSAVLLRLQGKLKQSQRLDKLIRQRIESRKLDGLHAEVDRLLLLCPDRDDLTTLKKQLKAREAKLLESLDEALVTARRLIGKHDYSGAIAELDQFNSRANQSRQAEIQQLLEEAETKTDRRKTLRSAIEDAVKTKHFKGLQEKVEECLLLSGDEPQLIQLRERLRARDKKLIAQIPKNIEEAKGHAQAARFDDALICLSRVPDKLQTDETHLLCKTFGVLGRMRQDAMNVLGKALRPEGTDLVSGPMSSGKPANCETAIERCDEYRSAVKQGGINDSSFESRLIECREMLRAKEARTQRVEHKQTLWNACATTCSGVGTLLLYAGGAVLAVITIGLVIGSIVSGLFIPILLTLAAFKIAFSLVVSDE